MNKIIVAVSLLLSINLTAQVKTVNLQASGLTCSMCSNAINKALKSIDYVEAVKPDIKNSSFEIYFKANSMVDFDLLKKKVEEAGFHVAKLTATIRFENQKIAEDAHVKWNGYNFHFLNVEPQILNGEKSVQILDKGFVSAKEFKKNQSFTGSSCYKSGVGGTSCSKADIPAGARIFHVTI